MATVLITGASSGIGLATATLLQQQGHKVYGTSRQPRNDFPFPILPLDLTQAASIDACVQAFFEREPHLDVLINNAGRNIVASVEEMPEQAMRDIFELHYFGVVALTRAFLTPMRQRQAGKIINITSIASMIALPFEAHYSASKAALELFSEALQREVEDLGIQVVLVEPGYVASNIKAAAVYVEQSEVYQAKVEHIRQRDSQQEDFLTPEYIATRVARVVATKKPRLRYLLGSPMENIGVIIKRFLPDHIFWGIVKRQMFKKEE